MDDVEPLVETYLTLRREREMLSRQDKLLKEDMEKLESAMLAICNATNMNGFKTRLGTVTRKVKERYVCSDWDNFKKFIETEGSVDLLSKTIHQSNFKEFMSERMGDGLPPGINALREYDIVVLKASSTSETLV
jgi:hypothetical protein